MYICIYHFCSWLAWRQAIGLGCIYSWGYMSGGYEHEKGEPFAQSSLIHFIVISYTIAYPYIRRKRLSQLHIPRWDYPLSILVTHSKCHTV